MTNNIRASLSERLIFYSLYTYDNRNRLTSVKQYDGNTLASTTSYTYDGVGNVLTMTSGGKTTTYTYSDLAGNRKVSTCEKGDEGPIFCFYGEECKNCA